MSLIQHLTMLSEHFNDPISRWMVQHGQSFQINPFTFSGERMEQGNCYENATLCAISAPEDVYYVEGKVTIYGVPINHAWNVTHDGALIDRTLVDKQDNRIGEYFGVVFSTRYLVKSIKKNGYYGLLDPCFSRKTVLKLIEGKVKFKP